MLYWVLGCLSPCVVACTLIFFFWFCRTWTKRYLITSQTRVKRVSRIHHRTILSLRMVRWCIRLTRLTLVCEVIRYRLVQVRQNQKKTFRVGGPRSPFSISSSFILSFVLLPFFLNTNMHIKIDMAFLVVLRLVHPICLFSSFATWLSSLSFHTCVLVCDPTRSVARA